MKYNSALAETWGLYASGSLIFIARIACRTRSVGFDRWKPDDYIVLLSWVTYTVMTVAAHKVNGLNDIHSLPIDQRKNMTQEEAEPYVYGTQWFCAGVATYILFIWTLKLNMLFLYQRVVRGLWVEKLIKPTMVLVVLTFVASFLILFCACRPYHRMWTVYPDQGPVCRPQSMLNMVPPLVMNIITDILIMAIPTPVVIGVKTTLWKRIAIIFLFSAGLFIMIAAIIRVSMVLVMQNGSTAAIWSCREDFVAIIVGQAILIRPLFSKRFWTTDYRHPSTGYSSRPSRTSGHLGGSVDGNGRRKSKLKDPFSVSVAMATIQGGRGESTENIVGSVDSQDGTMKAVRRHSLSSSGGDLESGVTLSNLEQNGYPRQSTRT